MHRVARTIISAALLLTAVAAPVPLPAAETSAAGPGSPNPAMEQLLRMANFLAQLPAFSVKLQCGYDVVQESGQKIEFGERRKLTLVCPDRFRVDVERSDGEPSSAVFDGKAVTVSSPKLNMFATSELSGDVDAAIIHFVKDLRMRLPLAMLLVTTLPKELEKRVLAADMVETNVLQGIPCVHLASRGERVDFQLWIPSAGDPLPQRVIITYKYEKGQPQYWANFSEWNLAPNPPATLFALDIPKDAGRIQFLSKVAQAAEPAKPAPRKGGKK
jgi:hypothetical protein